MRRIAEYICQYRQRESRINNGGAHRHHFEGADAMRHAHAIEGICRTIIVFRQAHDNKIISPEVTSMETS